MVFVEMGDEEPLWIVFPETIEGQVDQAPVVLDIGPDKKSIKYSVLYNIQQTPSCTDVFVEAILSCCVSVRVFKLCVWRCVLLLTGSVCWMRKALNGNCHNECEDGERHHRPSLCCEI